MNKSSTCPDCGLSGGTNHRLAKANATIDWLLEILTKPIYPMAKWLARVSAGGFDFFILNLFKLAAAVGPLSVSKKPLAIDTDRTRLLWLAADRRAINLRQFLFRGRPTNLFFGRLPSGTVVFEGLPRPDGSGGLEWIDNKALMKKVCHKTGIPTPNGRACFSLSAARKIFGKLEKPVVVKPALGSRSRHVRVHIKTEQAMAEAFWAAKQVSPVVVIEEELKGMVHRATVVGGKVRGVLRREPGFVVGDGVRTISQLVEEENKNPLRRGPIFHPIPINADFYAEIANQGFSENDLPPKGRLVTVSLKIGRSQGGTNTDVTDLVHSENLELFERIAAVFGESLVGIDFIIEDVSRSWRQQPLSGIIECNSVPFLDLHSFPFVGRPRDLFSALWDEVLKNQKVQFPKT